MNSELERLKQRLGKGGDQKRIDSEDDIIVLYHILMKEYGWIPLNQFLKLPLPVLWQLLEEIRAQREAEERQLNKAKRR